MLNQSHLDHLAILESILLSEKQRLNQAKNASERRIREVWVSQCEKEIRSVRAFLGLPESEQTNDMSDEELLKALGL